MYQILKKQTLNANTKLMVIEAPHVARKAEPGQFIILRVSAEGERIPLTIADFDREKGSVTIIFQEVGATTMALGALNEGDCLHDFVGPLGKASELEGLKKVAVVGGGNVAMDAARCAKRMGADEVYIVYRRSEKELPARLEEIHHAKEEGVVFKFLTAPLEVLSDENFNVTGLKCQQMELGEPDASGRRRPIPVEGSEFVLDLDCVIAAIGTSQNPLIRHTTPGLETNRKGCIVADDEHGITSKDGVFAGGDAVTGAATVILAMGAGKRAAAAMDEYIKNKNK